MNISKKDLDREIWKPRLSSGPYLDYKDYKKYLKELEEAKLTIKKLQEEISELKDLLYWESK